ncbi:MAG TPA: hypothetical protein VFZ16_06950 [Hyphomicrobiaceae bacterium]|nr:hypothetical protein [Hyphomicrobiaceae bacterium]
MATVPGCDMAIVEPAKVAGYLLSNSHPIGRGKAHFFTQFGFRQNAPVVLARALLDHVRIHNFADVQVSAYGAKYRVDGYLASPDRRNPRVSTVWMIRNGENAPRFITAFPC